MKLVIGLFLMTTMSWGAPLSLEGDFFFTGEYSQNLSYAIENVRSGRPSGDARLDELRSLGFACTYRSQGLYRCKKFSKAFSPSRSVIKKMIKKYSQTKVSLGKTLSPYEVIFEGSTLNEYRFYQEVLSPVRVDEYTYISYKGEGSFDKIEFEKNGRYYGYVIEGLEKISRQVELRQREGSRTYTYLMSLKYRKK